MATGSGDQDWKTDLCDPGEGADCPRSCFIGCDQYGRTHQRLKHLKEGEDPLDLSQYNGCNTPCWDYCLLCFGGLYIGSGVYTGKQTRQIRRTYNIKGTYRGDVAKGIFCQPCSLIQNDLEIRRREKGNRVELSQGLRGPVPLGEENFRPMFMMPVTDGYRAEPRMTTVNISGREAHFHHATETAGSGNEPRQVPLYPTEQDLRGLGGSWRGYGDLPQIPHVSSPFSAIDRRPQLLTPISERDSSTEDPRSQQLRENIPKFPRVQNWLKTMSPSPGDKPMVEKSVVFPGPGNPPSLVTHGRSCPRACPKPGKGPAKSPKAIKKVKSHKQASKKRTPFIATARDTPDILVTPTPDGIQPPGDIGEPTEQPTVRVTDARRSPEHKLGADILVRSPSGSQRQHSLQADILILGPAESQRQHSLHDDAILAGSLGSLHQHDIQDDVIFINPSNSQHPHDLSGDDRVPTPSGRPMSEHDLRTDKIVDFLPLTDRPHSLRTDHLVPVGNSPAREHNLDSDSVVSVEVEEWESELEEDALGHRLLADPEVSMPPAAIQEHSLESDAFAVMSKPTQARGHSLSKDIRVPTPTSRGAFAHGIHLDEKVPTPELVRLNLEHDILQDRRVLTPSPNNRDHNLQADKRVKSPVLHHPRQHSIRSDNQVSEPVRKAKEHSLRTDESVASPSSRRAKNHSISSDTRVAQRAYQLLENFLEQDRKPSTKGSK